MFLNRAAEGLVGQPEAALRGRRIRDFLLPAAGGSHAPDAPPLPDPVSAGGLCILRDGERIPVSCAVHPIDEPGVMTGAVVELTEIADRRDDELVASERLLSSVLDHLPVGVAVFGPDGRVTRTNRIMRRYAEGAIPSTDDEAVRRWHAVHPDGSVVDRRDFPGARALRGETVTPGIHFQYRQEDGTCQWTRVSAAPLRDGDGHVTGAVAVVTDIDAEKRSEQDLKSALADARQNELVAREMSHRIMNSFQLLQGLLSKQARSVADADARLVVEQALARVQAMAVLHRQLFEATRRDLTTLDGGAYIEGLAGGLAATFIDRDRRTLTVEVEPGMPLQPGQASSLGLIVTELSLNALKHAFTDAAPGRLAIRFGRNGALYRLSVADNGRGLPTGQAPSGSSGMGMRLVQGLVRQLDGTLDIDRTPPGTRFVVSFPPAG